MKNLDWCIYTYKHRRMFVYIAKKLIKDEALLGSILERAKTHDVDKLIMYMSLDQRISQEHHVLIRPHHLECKVEKCYEDLLETVIDYECSPYTKPDKPLNAYDFLNKLLDMKLVEKDIADRDSKIKGYEVSAMKHRIAHESGLSYDAVDFLQGSDEDTIRASADKFKNVPL